MENEQWESGNTGLETEHLDAHEGKPLRDRAIQQDDVLNLRIALNTAQSPEQFLEKV
jgi:hypothetical protein